MHNLIEYSKNYRKTTGSLWNYYRDGQNNPLSPDSESSKCKISITGKTIDNNDALENLNNFWRTFNIPLINCEIESNCALADITVRATRNNNDPLAIVGSAGLEFQIIEAKLYDPVVTLLKENAKKLVEKLKLEFKRTVKWNKYRS